jgi:hypothetical protein
VASSTLIYELAVHVAHEEIVELFRLHNADDRVKDMGGSRWWSVEETCVHDKDSWLRMRCDDPFDPGEVENFTKAMTELEKAFDTVKKMKRDA